MKLKKILKIFLLLIAVIVIFFVGAICYMNWLFKLKDSVELTSTTVEQEIPFYWSDTGHIIIEATINNSKYPFLLDSGAGSMVVENLIEEQKLNYICPGFSIDAAGRFLFPGIYRVDKIGIKDITFVNAAVGSIDKLLTPCLNNVYGIIGKDIMQHLVWQIDFKKKIIRVTSNKNQLAFDSNVEIIPLNENQFGHHLYVSVNLGSSNFISQVMLDTGNSGNLDVGTKDVEAFNLETKQVEVIGSSITGLAGKSPKKVVYQQIKNFQIGDIIIPDFFVSISDISMGFLGLDFLKNYRTTISWKDKELLLEPYDNQNFTRKTFGFNIDYDKAQHTVLVDVIYEGSTADSLGIQIGDSVLKMNGYQMDSVSDYCAFSFQGIDTLHIELERNGVLKTFKVPKAPLFSAN